MPARFSIRRAEREGYATATLAAPGGLEATFAPGLALLCCSLRQGGEELLARRADLATYVSTGRATGIPLLHPWANRLAGFRYTAAGRTVELDPASPLLQLEEHGLPIHGLKTAGRFWGGVSGQAGPDAAGLRTSLDLGAHPELLAAFPYPHEITLTATLTEDALRYEASVRPTGDAAVPVAFGFHPFLVLPGVPRADWQVELPVRRRALLDGRGIPTGEEEDVDIPPGPLGERTYDDAFSALREPAVFALSGGGRRIEVAFERGFPRAQVFAPPGRDLISFEPMTALPNALVAGGAPLVEPGETYDAAFSVRVR